MNCNEVEYRTLEDNNRYENANINHCLSYLPIANIRYPISNIQYTIMKKGVEKGKYKTLAQTN